MADKQEKTPSNLSAFGTVEYTFDERKFLQDSLGDKLPQEFISKRQGPGGGEVHYVETWRVIELANQTFGFNGWSSSIIEITQDYMDQTPAGRFNAGISAIVRISLKDGSFHEDVGYGTSDNQKHKGAALEHAKKKAVSDALKRALRNFGNKLGLTIYDRDHIKQMKRQTTKKVVPSGAKMNPHFVSQVQPGATQMLDIVPSSSHGLSSSLLAPSQCSSSQYSSSLALSQIPAASSSIIVEEPISDSIEKCQGIVQVKKEEQQPENAPRVLQSVNSSVPLGKLSAPPRTPPVVKAPLSLPNSGSQASSPPNPAMPKAPPRAPPPKSLQHTGVVGGQIQPPRAPLVGPAKHIARSAPVKRSIAEANAPISPALLKQEDVIASSSVETATDEMSHSSVGVEESAVKKQRTG